MRFSLGNADLPAGRVFCIGRNYAEHVREMGNEPGDPVVFMKPTSSLVPPGRAVRFPRHGQDLQHEAELVLIVGTEVPPGSDPGWECVAGVALGLDLTLRDLQADLKRRGMPWEPAKAFDDSAPLGSPVPLEALSDRDRIRFECRVNGALRQRGDTAHLIYSVPRLLRALSRVWRLRGGDVIYTGTPEGVGPLRPGDEVEVASDEIGSARWKIGS